MVLGPIATVQEEDTMKKIRLRMDALEVESFALAEASEPRQHGTVRGNAVEDTLVRACQTQQFDCTAQGGYTCDYGYCVSGEYCA